MSLCVVLACSTGPVEHIEQCTDLPCREAWALAHWEADPTTVIAGLKKVDDPLERTILVDRLLETGPKRTKGLCETLPKGDSAKWCRQTISRRHLWQRQNPGVVTTSRRAGGPTASKPTTAAIAQEMEAQPPPEDCAGEASPSRCLNQHAQRAARKGDVPALAGACAAVGTEIWRDECYFVASEELLRARGIDAYPAGINLCLLAGRFRAQCLGHSVTRITGDAPAADAPQPAQVDTLIAGAAQVAQAWATLDPVFGEDAVQRFWSASITVAFDKASRTTGDLLDHLPEDLAPFVHAAAADALTARTPPEHTLAQRTAALDEALALRGPGTSPPRRRSGAKPPDLWPQDEAGDDDVPAIVYLRDSRRTFSPNPAVDRTIAILEAVARSDTPAEAVLQQGEVHEDSLVSWTASRLLRQLQTPSTTAPNRGTAPGRR